MRAPLSSKNLVVGDGDAAKNFNTRLMSRLRAKSPRVSFLRRISLDSQRLSKDRRRSFGC